MEELNFTALILLGISLGVNIFQNVMLQRWRGVCRTWREACQNWRESSGRFEALVERLEKIANKDAKLLAAAAAEINLLKQQNHDQRLRLSQCPPVIPDAP